MLFKLMGQDREVDLGNWTYSVLLNMLSEMARGCERFRGVNDIFDVLTERLPSVQRKWNPSKGSLVRKGDVIEVCLAFYRLTDTIDKDIAHGRREYSVHVANFDEQLKGTIECLCDCEGRPTQKILPSPTNFARLLIFTWASIHNRDDKVREESRIKAESEMVALMVRIGVHNWQN